MAKVLVTGGAGFIGSHLTETLLQRGDEVVVVDDESTGRYENLAAVHDHPRLTYVRGSIGEESLVHRVAAEVEEVYHLAAAVGVALIARQPIETIERNIYPTQLLLDKVCARVARGESVKIFLASTSEVYGKNPKPVWDEEDDLVFGSTTRARWSYGASKAIDEFLALACWRQSRVPVVVGTILQCGRSAAVGSLWHGPASVRQVGAGRGAPGGPRRWAAGAVFCPRPRRD